MDDSIMRGTAANGNAVEAKGGGCDAAAELAKKFRCVTAGLCVCCCLDSGEISLALSPKRWA